ncbi:MAG: glycosyltransferase family 39 protein [Planctomycetota bacterium]
MQDSQDHQRSRRDALAATSSVLVGLVLVALSFIEGEGPLPPPAMRQPWMILPCVLLAALLVSLPALEPWREKAGRLLFESRALAFSLVLFVVSAATCILVSLVVFKGIPRIDDEVAALFQARIFAQGNLVLPVPPHGRFFDVFGVLGTYANARHWCSMYPPGWSLLLVPGVWLGASWLINPLLGGLMLVMISAVGTELFGRKTGRLAGVLALCSPFIATVNSMHLSHTSTALFLLLTLWATLRMLRTGHKFHGLLAGGAWSFAYLIRPLTALVIGAMIALWPLFHWRRSLAARRAILLAVVMAAGGGGALMAWQRLTTGDPFLPGHVVGMREYGEFGFGPIDQTIVHTPAKGLEHTLGRMRAVNDHLLGWFLPSALVFLFPLLRGRARAREAWLLTPWLSLLAAFFPYWYWEMELPARYTFCATPMLVILAARGVELATGAGSGRPDGVRKPAVILVLAALLFSATTSFPSYLGRFGPNYCDVESALPRLMEKFQVHHAVVFMQSRGRAPKDQADEAENDYYATGFMRNELDLQGDVIYARESGFNRDLQMLALHPDRKYYQYVYLRAAGDAELYELTYVPGASDFQRRLLYAPAALDSTTPK